MMMGTSGQQHWELMPKIDPIEADGIDVDTVDAFLDPSKDFEHLDFGEPAGGVAGAGGMGPGVIGVGGRGVGASETLPSGGAAAMANMSVAGGSGGVGAGTGTGALNAAMFPGGAFYEGHTQMPASPVDQKSQIIHDCMWAGMCDDQSHPEKSGGCSRCAHQQQQHYRQQLQTLHLHHHLHHSHQTEESQGQTAGKVSTAQRTFSTPPRVATNNTNQFRPSPTSLLAPFKATQSAAEIPAGGSLLKRQQQQQQQQLQQQQQQQQPSPATSSDSSSSSSSSAAGGGDGPQSVGATLRVPYLPRGTFLADKERQVLASCASQQHHARPDTPLSLDDDAPEFKHNLDLVATCTIGSNQQSLLQQQQQHHTSAASTGESRHAGGSIATASQSSPVSCSSSTSGSSNGIGSYGSSPRASISTSTSTTTSGQHTPQYYYNYLQDATVEHMRLNKLCEQLVMIDDPNVMPGGGGAHCHPDAVMRPDSPDNALTQLLCDLRDIEMKDSEDSVRGSLFGAGDCSSLLAGSGSGSMVGHAGGVASGTAATSGGALGGGVSLIGALYQHRIAQRSSVHHNLYLGGTSVGTGSSLHQSDLHLHDLHHHQHVSACRCEQVPHLRGCSMFHHGGVGVRQHLASRKRPYTWIDCAYDDEAFDDGDAEEDVVKQLEQEDDDDELLFGTNGAEFGASSCSSEDDDEDDDDEEEEDDEEDEEEDEEDTCSVASSGGSDRRLVGRRTRRPMQSYQHPASAVRSRSHHRQHQRRRAALVVPASRPYDASATRKSRKSKQQKPQKKQLGAEVSYIATEVHVTTAPSSPNSSTDHHLGAPIAPNHSECHQATHVGDHSYTRPKGRFIMNELGVQTPSDSEEEIDVVSIGDKNLPTNPTARNRRHLESEVASKIRTASSRPPNGALHYDRHGGSSYHHHHHHHHHPHHRQQTPQHGHDDVVGGSTRGQPLLGGMYPTPAGSTTISGANTPLPTGSGCHSAASSPPPPVAAPSSMSRRRTHGAAGNKRGTSGAAGGPSTKRMRQHHSKRSSNGHEGRSGADSAGGTPHDELDTAEKRNLHNDMERQRRIGLKNLFEELKRQIPNLRDKDRAPKVNILREAAALCNRLNRESDQINELRQHQKKLYERVRFLRSSMHTQRAQHATPVAE
ncbi:uncharacterized protein LOC131290534 [Anopheles ziemanni]|uniref:uncharacterized protein LOC131290534 n=1 Tax=Anopheles ziemanni TaxID=345580 RepID=UPI002660553C|nr:uncharacterized protein LOC131290534 [Anopheles ziemanni]